MSSHRNVTIGDIFTAEELQRANDIIKAHDKSNGNVALIDTLENEIVVPVLPRINQSTGQDNDARYLAYMLEHIIRNIAGGPR